MVLIPVLVWGRIIAARAVVSNETLYAFAARGDAMSVASGVVRELTSFHLPWIDTAEFPGAGFFMVLRSASSGLTPWVGLLVAAVLVLVALRTIRPRPLEDPAGPAAEVQGDDEQGTQVLRAVGGATTTLQPLVLLAATTVLTIVLYPPALRLANALNFGFDFPIVSRYTVSFAPMMALLVALLVPGKALPRLLAGVAVVVVLGLSFSWV